GDQLTHDRIALIERRNGDWRRLAAERLRGRHPRVRLARFRRRRGLQETAVPHVHGGRRPRNQCRNHEPQRCWRSPVPEGCGLIRCLHEIEIGKVHGWVLSRSPPIIADYRGRVAPNTFSSSYGVVTSSWS